MIDLPKFTFFIDTDSYAGNFERETCAYVTGHIGDCEVGDDTVVYVKNEMGAAFEALYESFEDVLTFMSDDHGCQRPCGIGAPPKYHSVAIYFHERPSDEMIELMKQRAIEFSKMKIHEFSTSYEVKGFRLVSHRIVEDELENWTV